MLYFYLVERHHSRLTQGILPTLIVVLVQLGKTADKLGLRDRDDSASGGSVELTERKQICVTTERSIESNFALDPTKCPRHNQANLSITLRTESPEGEWYSKERN